MHRANRGNFSRPTITRSHHRNCEKILGVSSLPLVRQFFADSDRHALISVLTSYCRFDVEIQAEGHHFHAGNCRGCGRYRDLVAKIKIAKFFSCRVCWWFGKICARENFPLYGSLGLLVSFPDLRSCFVTWPESDLEISSCMCPSIACWFFLLERLILYT